MSQTAKPKTSRYTEKPPSKPTPTTTPLFTRRYLLNVYHVIQRLLEGQTPLPIKYAYFLGKNLDRLEVEIRPIAGRVDTNRSDTSGMPVEFARAYGEAARKAVKKDENGRPIVINGRSPFEEPAAWLKTLDELTKQYEKEITEAQAFLQEETPFEFYTLFLAEFPKEILPADMRLLLPLVRDEEAKP